MLQQQKKQICVIYCIILILAATVLGIGDIESSRMGSGGLNRINRCFVKSGRHQLMK